MPRRYGRMRFSDTLEAEFREHYLADGRYGRIYALLMPLLLFGLAPFYGGRMFSTPELIKPLVRALELGVVAPTMAIALLCTVWGPLKKYSETACLAAMFSLCMVTLLFSVAGMDHGFPFPTVFSAVYTTTIFVLARIHFRGVATVAAAVFVTVVITEYLAWGRTTAVRFDVFAQVALFVAGGFGGYLFEFSHRQSWLREKMLERISCTDSLTGVFNRRGFDGAFERTLRQARRENKPVFVAALDLDHFKPLNDHYGHEYGDIVLQTLGKFLREFARRPLDSCGRVGGEEFVVILYDCSPKAGADKLQKLVDGVRELRVENRQSPVDGLLTASAGGLSLVPGERTLPTDVLRRADRLLYQAKRNGRNRAEFLSVSDPSQINTGNWGSTDALKNSPLPPGA